MVDLRLQDFQANELPVLETRNDRLPYRPMERTDETTSFSHALERASARETRAEKQESDLRQQSEIEQDRSNRENDQSTRVTLFRERPMEKRREIDQNPATGTHGAAQAGSQAAATSAAQQAGAVKAPVSDQTPKNDVEITASRTNSGDDVKVSLHGLPEELLTVLLLALENSSKLGQPVTFGTANQAVKSALDEGSLESLPDGSVKLTVKLGTDPADPLNGMNEILSLIQALTDVLQDKASNKVELQSGQVPITDLIGSDDGASPKQAVPTTFRDLASHLLAQLLQKEAPADGASPKQAVLRDLASDQSTQDAQATTNRWTGLNGSNGVNLIPNGVLEVKLPQGTDLTESLLSKVKVTVSLPGVGEGTSVTADKGAGLPSEGNGKSAFGEQGATMQAGIQRAEPVAEASKATSFGSIVADRLAAVAEQVGLRERSLDITLRLKMEGGESLMVGLRDQAGKIMVNIRCADQNMVSLLESQKETIVRHLEAKQVSASVSVSPIEQDLTKRQSRENPKNMWGRQRDPFNPYVEIEV